MREGKTARVLARFKRPSRGGNRGRIVGAGGEDLAVLLNQEREEAVGERGSWPVGPRPRKRRRGAGFGPCRPKGEGRGGRVLPFSFFFKQIFQHIFQLNF